MSMTNPIKTNRITDISVENKQLDEIRLQLTIQIRNVNGEERLLLIWQRNVISQQIQDNFDEYLSLLTYKSDQGIKKT